MQRRRTPGIVVGVMLGVMLGALASPAIVAAQDSAAAKTSAAVYTDEQAERGNGVFTRTCVECHTRKDMSGADFRLKWNGRTVFELFDQIRTTMPDATPGSMTPAEYADVTAYFLKLNGMPAGSVPLPPDSTLRAIKLDIPATPPGQFVMRSVMHPVLPSRPAHSSPLRRGS